MSMVEELSKIVHMLPSIGTTSSHLSQQCTVFLKQVSTVTPIIGHIQPSLIHDPNKVRAQKKPKESPKDGGQRGQTRQLGVLIGGIFFLHGTFFCQGEILRGKKEESVKGRAVQWIFPELAEGDLAQAILLPCAAVFLCFTPFFCVRADAWAWIP